MHRIIKWVSLTLFVGSLIAFLAFGGNFVWQKYQVYERQQSALKFMDAADATIAATKRNLRGTKTSINVQDQSLKVVAAIVVPKISMTLPVFDNSSTEALNVGAGWLPGSSPIGGGKTTHAVIDAHSGKSATLFTKISKLKKGDPIYLKTTAGKILEYKVIAHKVYKPTYTADLMPQNNKDLLTLITCYPLYQNTHRLHVTAERVPYDHKYAKTSDWLTWTFDHAAVVIGVVLALVVGAIVTAVVLYLRKKERDSWTVIHYEGRRLQ